MFRIYVILEIICVIHCLHYLYGKKICYTLPDGIFNYALILCQIIVFELMHIYNSWKGLSWIMLPLITVYTIIEFGANIKKVVASNILCMLVISLLELFIGLISAILRLDKIPDDIMAINVYCIILAVLWLLRNMLQKSMSFFLLNNYLVASFLMFFVFYLLESLFKYKKSAELSLDNFLALFIFGSGLCVISYFWQKEKMETDTIKKDWDLHQIYDDSYKELLDTVRKTQHDFNNHMQAIIGMCYTTKDYDELVKQQIEYIGQMSDRNADYKLLNSKWPLVAGFLHSKINEAWERGIKAKYEIDITQKVGRIPEYVIIEMIGILLDNAIEAVEGTKQPFFSIKIFERKGRFHIVVANPVEQLLLDDIHHFFEKGYSSKEGHRGYGLNKIKEYSIQYQMELVVKKNTSNETDYFFVMITI